MQNSNESFQEGEDQDQASRDLAAARKRMFKMIRKRQREHLTGSGSSSGDSSFATPDRQGVVGVQSTPVCSDGGLVRVATGLGRVKPMPTRFRFSPSPTKHGLNMA